MKLLHQSYVKNGEGEVKLVAEEGKAAVDMMGLSLHTSVGHQQALDSCSILLPPGNTVGLMLCIIC